MTMWAVAKTNLLVVSRLDSFFGSLRLAELVSCLTAAFGLLVNGVYNYMRLILANKCCGVKKSAN